MGNAAARNIDRILTSAVELTPAFVDDMKKILGPSVVANCKVRNKKVSYSDPAVSRIFFKIHETLKKKVAGYNDYLGVYENKKEGISIDVRTEFLLDAIEGDRSKIE